MKKVNSYSRHKAWLMPLLVGALVAGCGDGGRDPILGGGGGVAALAPTVTNVAPLDNATGVGTANTVITAQFSEPMAPVTAANFTVTCTTSCTNPPTGTVALNAAKTIATFTLSNSPLLALTTYTATVTGAKSIATGLALASPFVWHFTTGATPDTTRPRVTLTIPADAAVDVATNTAITAVFSEEINPVTIESPATSFTLACASCVSTSVTGNVSYAVGSRTAVFTPTTPAVLEAGKTYTATITVAATDLAGNTLTSGLVPNPWTFTTAQAPALDTTAPKVSSTNPANGAAAVDVNQLISATFNEAMKATTISTGSFTLTGPGATPVAGTVSYDALNNIATFTPSNPPLAFSTLYTATITNAATDLAGNALLVPAASGLPVPNPWTFTTADAPIVIPPPAPALAINLRSAASFGIASRAGLTSTGVTVVNGDVALWPTATCTDSTGGPGGASRSCLFKTYPTDGSLTGLTVNGSIYFAGDPFDNGGTANAVANDLQIAWNEARNKVDTQGAILADEMGGKTFFPGVYHNANLGLMIGGVATLDAQNDANAIFIFKVDSTFVDSGTLLSPSQIKLINGAQARNVWFVTGLDLTIGSGTSWNGNILVGRDATVNMGSTVLGRVLAGASGAGAFVLTGAATPSVTTITVPQ